MAVNYIQITVLIKNSKISDKPKLQADHGLSFFIAATIDDDKVTVRMDTGPSSNSLLNNVDTMNINLKDADVIALSHGHYDHTGGLIEALKQIKNVFQLLGIQRFSIRNSR